MIVELINEGNRISVYLNGKFMPMINTISKFGDIKLIKKEENSITIDADEVVLTKNTGDSVDILIR